MSQLNHTGCIRISPILIFHIQINGDSKCKCLLEGLEDLIPSSEASPRGAGAGVDADEDENALGLDKEPISIQNCGATVSTQNTLSAPPVPQKGDPCAFFKPETLLGCHIMAIFINSGFGKILLKCILDTDT